MSLTPEEPMIQPGLWRRFIDHLPPALAIIVTVLTLLGFAAGLTLVVTRRADLSFWGSLMLGFAGLLVLGAGLSGLLLILNAMSRQLVQLSDRVSAIDQRATLLAEQAMAQAQRDTAAAQRRPEAEIRGLLLEIRETLLLPEPERQRRFERLVEREFQRGLTTAEQLVASRDFHRAREVLMALGERFGSNDRLREAEQKLERAAEVARASDITEAIRRVEDQMALARWDEAEAVARELADKYPIASEPAALIIRVQRERKVYEQRHRLRLHEEIQQFVHDRRWQEAAAAARRFIENFPTGPDTEALRGQMETLQANADIQLRQQLEAQLKEHLKAQQYWDALALARRILTEHPLSPQANALRGQIARLEELARRQPPPADVATPA